MGLLDGGLRDDIAAAFQGQLLTAILYQNTTPDSGGTDDLGDPTDVSRVPHDVEGFIENYSAEQHLRSGIPENDLKVCLFGSYIPGIMPDAGWLVNITAPAGSLYNGRWYQVRKRKIDPAGALWELQSFEITQPAGLP